MSTLISVILTSYNKPQLISQAIESVIKQSYSNWELFIMDDHSNQETVRVIQKYLDDPRISYFNSHIQDSERHKTTRYATLINKAIPMTSGQYITYLTDDNFFLPERFATMIDVFKKNSKIEIVYSQQLVRMTNQFGEIENETLRKTYGVLNNAVGLVDHCSIMHTRKIANDIFRKYGTYWDDHPTYWFNGDAAFWRRLTEFQPFYPIQQPLDIAIKDPQSFQRLYHHLPKDLPNGVLVKSPKSEIYLMDNDQRRKISHKVFERLKYEHDLIVTIPDPILFKYKEGIPIDIHVFENLAMMPTQRLVKSDHSPNIYFLQNHQKHLIPNERAFRDYKFKQKNIVIVDDQLLSYVPEGKEMKELYKDPSILPDGILFKCESFFLSSNHFLHPIDKEVAMKLNLPISDPVIVDDRFIKRFPRGVPYKWEIRV